MATYRLLFGTVGSGLSYVESLLRRSGHCAVEDVEERLKNRQETLDALMKADRHIDRPTMEDVTYYLPRERVKQLWKVSAEECLLRLAAAKAPLKVLAGHLVYYSARRNEFYSVVDPSVLREFSTVVPRTMSRETLKASAVALLIDDVYDAFDRLRQPGSLFCDRRAREFILQMCDDWHTQPDRLSDTDNQRLVLAWKFGSLDKLLSWRSLELVLAEHLARLQLNVRFMVFAVKQLQPALALWLRDEGVCAVYLSHPITEARRDLARTGRWPRFVTEVNEVQSLFRRQNVVAVMPTAIDEFRFERARGIFWFSGDLSRRWPLPDGPLLCERGTRGDQFDRREILRPQTCRVIGQQDRQGVELAPATRCSRMVGASLRRYVEPLVEKVTRQISGRDHLFVVHCGSVLFYRPLYGGRLQFSAGVQAEETHWLDLRQLDKSRRAAFVHFDEDVAAMLQRLDCQAEPLPVRVKSMIRYLLETKDDVLGQDVQNHLIDKGELPPKGLLDGMPRDAVACARRLPERIREAKILLLRSHLTHIDKDLPGEIKIWVVANFEEFRRHVPHIAHFLATGASVREDWCNRIDDLLPDDLWK